MIWRTLAAHGRLVFKRALSAEPPPIIFTDRAVQRLKKITKGGEHLRITVEGGGCAGFEYKFSLDSNRAEDDVVIKKEGAELVVDQLSLDFIKGSTVDYTEDLMRAAFKITQNPLATQGCSCGSSFSPKSLS